MKLKYVEWHYNYDELNIGEVYEGFLYTPNPDWYYIDGVLYRKECFEVVA